MTARHVAAALVIVGVLAALSPAGAAPPVAPSVIAPEGTVIFCRRWFRKASIAASKVEAMIRSFSAIKSYAYSWK